MIDEIICGDCLEIMKQIPDNTIDIAITDPPYSSGGAFRSDRNAKVQDKYQVSGTEKIYPTFGGDNRDQRSFLMWSTLWCSEIVRTLKPGSVIAIFSDWRQLPTTTDVLQAGGAVWRGVYVWDKTESARPEMGLFRNQCEFIIWGTKGAKNSRKDISCPAGVFRKSVNPAEKFHITGKPIELMEELIQIAPDGGIMLDPFIGSGTSAVAAKRTGRHFIGIEMSPEYCEIARRRVAAVPARLDSFFEVPA